MEYLLLRDILKMPQNQASSSVRNRSQVLQDKQFEWDRYFLEMLELVKRRSPDKETQVACILTENNRIISQGYNGWPSHIDNLPNTRPDKYPFMVHSEINAIANLLVKPTNPTAYLTHYPCNICLKALWQISCRRVVVPKNRKFFSFSQDDQIVLDLFRGNGLELVEIGQSKEEMQKKIQEWFKDEFTYKKIEDYEILPEVETTPEVMEKVEEVCEKMRENLLDIATKEAGYPIGQARDYYKTKFVRVGQGISKVEHFGDFE